MLLWETKVGWVPLRWHPCGIHSSNTMLCHQLALLSERKRHRPWMTCLHCTVSWAGTRLSRSWTPGKHSLLLRTQKGHRPKLSLWAALSQDGREDTRTISFTQQKWRLWQRLGVLYRDSYMSQVSGAQHNAVSHLSTYYLLQANAWKEDNNGSDWSVCQHANTCALFPTLKR